MKYRLGIDMGSTSLGWCVLELNAKDDIKEIVDAGVRIFHDGRDAKTKEPLAVSRRNARSIRRNRDRYIKRRKRLMERMIEFGLMPRDEKERKKLQLLDPYEIRNNAANKKVPLYEIGRAFFHIDQRRGFKSNRKSDKKAADEKGKINEASKWLAEELKSQDYKSIGQFFYYKLKKGESVRVRLVEKKYDFYPLRWMYEAEVDLILSVQKKYHKELTDKRAEEIKNTIFFQRDLKPLEVGLCEFEEGKKRIAKAHPLFQEFRIEQEVNALETDGMTGEYLSPEHRKIIKKVLINCEIEPNKSNLEISFVKLKKIAGLPRNTKFNFETENRKGFKCHTTNYMLSGDKAFGKKWFDESTARKEAVEILLSDKNDIEILDWLLKEIKVDKEKAEYIMHLPFEDGYGSLSREAIEKILPYLREGLIYSKACEKAGYHHSDHRPKEVLESLPYYGEVLKNKVIGGSNGPEDKNNPEKYYGKINNPSVHIALNQLRKIVNAVVKKYGQPCEIAIETARELQTGTKGLKEIEKMQGQNLKDNERINGILEKQGLPLNTENRLRYKLWEELGKPQDRRCVFSGEQISEKNIWSDKFEIEHLLPFSRTYDDRRANKTLSLRQANRVKKNKTPFEAFGESKEWEKIMKRVQKLPDNKKWRFGSDAMKVFEKEGGAIARMLNDTRYMSRVAKEYLSYICDPNKVYGIPGQLTGILRGTWGLNLLKDKSIASDYRADHRHHMIDAFVTGCTTRGMLQIASRCSEWADKAGGQYAGRKKLFKDRFLPFEKFEDKERGKLMKMVENKVVSYKPDHKGLLRAVADKSTIGLLHEETAYGPAKRKAEKKGKIMVSVRKSVFDITEKELDSLVDKNAAKRLKKIFRISDKAKRTAALEKYSEEQGIKRVKLCLEKDEKVLIPVYRKDKDGNRIGDPYKYYVSGNNYCLDIYCLRPDDKRDPKNAGKWKGEVISNFAAHQLGFEPEWRKNHPTAKRIMRLFIDDMVMLTFDRKEMDAKISESIRDYVIESFSRTKDSSVDLVFRVKKMTGGRVFIRPHFVARENADQKSWGAFAGGLLEKKARKIFVNELGEVTDPGFKMGWE